MINQQEEKSQNSKREDTGMGVFGPFCGGVEVSWLVYSMPDRVDRVRALAGDIVLCSWARHLTHTVPLSTQVSSGERTAGCNPVMDYSSIPPWQ